MLVKSLPRTEQFGAAHPGKFGSSGDVVFSVYGPTKDKQNDG